MERTTKFFVKRSGILNLAIWKVVSILLVLCLGLFGIFYWRANFSINYVPMIEPDSGPRKIRYLLPQSAQNANKMGNELYELLRFKKRFEQFAESVSILRVPERPSHVLEQKVQSNQHDIQGETISPHGWNLYFNSSNHFAENDSNLYKRKLYRIRVATVRSPEHAVAVWSAIKATNPLIFEKCNFIVDKTVLSDGAIVYCVALGEYKDRKDTYAMVSRLKSVGQHSCVYEVLE
jgi:hypothetical protein